MPLASILTEITDAVTDAIGNHGLYAVFGLMLVDAVLPAASEVVMVYAGAVAAGAFAGQSVTLFGHTFADGFPAYLAMALAGTIGYLLGSIGGWWIGDYGGRPYLERHGRWLHLDEAKLDRAEAGSTAGETGPSSSVASHRSSARSSRCPPVCSARRSCPTSCSRRSARRSGASPSPAPAGRRVRAGRSSTSRSSSSTTRSSCSCVAGIALVGWKLLRRRRAA